MKVIDKVGDVTILDYCCWLSVAKAQVGMLLCVLPLPWSGSSFAWVFGGSRDTHPGWVQAVEMAMPADGCGGPRHCSEEMLEDRGPATCSAAVLWVSPGQACKSGVFLALCCPRSWSCGKMRPKSPPWMDSTFPRQEGLKPLQDSQRQLASRLSLVR